LLAPGVGFEPTRPKGAQADCPGSFPVASTVPGKGPLIIANELNCPVPGSGIPAQSKGDSRGTISYFGLGNPRVKRPKAWNKFKLHRWKNVIASSIQMRRDNPAKEPNG